eukprot:Skav221652  [mRNA]  locus=scaffold1750:56267:71783:+ [translate_table: standard]
MGAGGSVVEGQLVDDSGSENVPWSPALMLKKGFLVASQLAYINYGWQRAERGQRAWVSFGNTLGVAAAKDEDGEEQLGSSDGVQMRWLSWVNDRWHEFSAVDSAQVEEAYQRWEAGGKSKDHEHCRAEIHLEDEVEGKSAKEEKQLLALQLGVSRFRQQLLVEDGSREIPDAEVLGASAQKVQLVLLEL